MDPMGVFLQVFEERRAAECPWEMNSPGAVVGESCWWLVGWVIHTCCFLFWRSIYIYLYLPMNIMLFVDFLLMKYDHLKHFFKQKMIPPWCIASFTLFWDVYLYTSWDRIVPLTFLTYPCCLVIMAIEGRFHVPFGKLRPVPPRFQPDPFRFCWGWGFKSRMDDATHGETVESTVGNHFL